MTTSIRTKIINTNTVNIDTKDLIELLRLKSYMLQERIISSQESNEKEDEEIMEQVVEINEDIKYLEFISNG